MTHKHDILHPQDSCTQTGKYSCKPEITMSQAGFVHFKMNELTNPQIPQAEMLRWNVIVISLAMSTDTWMQRSNKKASWCADIFNIT